MSRTALILAAHGSRHEPVANVAIRQMADALTQRLHFDEIVAAFHQGEPTFATVLDRIDADEVIVVPVMTSEGYYCREFLPGELQKNRRYPDVRLIQARPIGVHPAMVELVRQRANKLLEMYGFNAARTTLAVVGHGTPRNPQSRIATERLVDALRGASPFGDVIAAFLDEEPAVERIVEQADNSDIIVIPFLISTGPHARSDIPRRLGMSRDAEFVPPLMDRIGTHRVICDRPIGADPQLIDIIAKLASGSLPLRRGELGWGCRENARTLRLGTRGSAMALWQAEHVASQLRTLGAEIEIVELSTLGDRVTDRAIAELPSDDPFSGDIEDALRDGRIDLAVHCLKDLPLRESPGLCIAATLKRDEITEAIVSRDGRRLCELPPGAVIGTSSPRRTAQLLAVRPDVRVATIRGPVDDRVRQVQCGRFDATILAVAGLRRLGLMGSIAEILELSDFLPAPGQGALVIQVRGDDESMRRLCSNLDDPPTRLATMTELEFLRPFEHRRNPVAAAYAIVDGQIRLHTRLLSADGRAIQDAVVTGSDPIHVARRAIERWQVAAPVPSNDNRHCDAVGAAT